MGYSIYQIRSEFFIPKKVKFEALSAIKKFTEKLYTDAEQSAFIQKSEVNEADDLENALMAWRWIPEVNGNGDVISIDFSGEKLGNDYKLFESIAKYVKDNSYIILVGEDSKVWRWMFLSGKVIEQEGKINFD